MTSPSLAEVIAVHLPGVYGTEPGRWSRHIADDIEARFLLIPRHECEPVVKDYEVPIEVLEDSQVVEGYHGEVLAQAVAGAVRNGLLIVSSPELEEGPRAPYAFTAQFQLRATGWRPR